MKLQLLMCAPEYFGVHYTINPWMENQVGQVDSHRARGQWEAFYRAIRQRAEVHLITPRPHVPDLVFTANAGLPLNGLFVPSRFKHPERRSEEPLFQKWFARFGKTIVPLPEEISFEGAGDALLQPERNLLWAAYGFRTDLQAHHFLAERFEYRVISLRLSEPRFYHLDTCFCPLQDGQVMYYPPAFDGPSQKLIEATVASHDRVVVPDADAARFACNAVLIDRTLFMNHAGPELRTRLEQAGYTPEIRPVSEFLKAGGANKCLTIALN